MFLQTIAPEDATGEIAAIYNEEIAERGFLMEATACWTTKPDLLPLFEHFLERFTQEVNRFGIPCPEVM